MKKTMFGLFMATVLLATGCATVDITKTATGFHEPTAAGTVEILMTVPKREYIELATVSTTNWKPSQTAKMHNAMRAKSAPLGANAVVIMASGVNRDNIMWTTGVAIRYKK